MCGFMLLVYPSAGQWAMTLLFLLWFLTHCISNLTHLNWVRLTAGRVNYTISLVLNILGINWQRSCCCTPSRRPVSMSLTIGFYLILLGVDASCWRSAVWADNFWKEILLCLDHSNK